jgi:hypothetical protein
MWKWYLREIRSRSVISIQVDVVLDLCEHRSDISDLMRMGYLFINRWFISTLSLALLSGISLCEYSYQMCNKETTQLRKKHRPIFENPH